MCFEDADMALRGKEATQEFFAEIVKDVSAFSKVIITGIGLWKRVSTVARLIGELADMYAFVEK